MEAATTQSVERSFELIDKVQESFYHTISDHYNTLAAIKLNYADPDFVLRTCERSMEELKSRISALNEFRESKEHHQS